MKRTHISVLNVCLVALMVPLCGCPPDPHIKVKTPYVEITPIISCSPDLLLFVTPVVEIRNSDNSVSQTYTLTESDFKETEEGGSIDIVININGESITISSTPINNIAEVPTQRFDGLSVSGEISVSYKKKTDVKIEKDKYLFFHQVNYKETMFNGISEVSSIIEIKPIGYEVYKDDVEEYIYNLISSPCVKSFQVP